MSTEIFIKERIINEFSKAGKESELSLKLTKDKLKSIRENDLIFQALSWYGDDFPDKYLEINEEAGGEIDHDPVSYQLYIHGRTIDNISVCLRVKNFTPYFYIEVPQKWSNLHTQKLTDKIKQKLGNYAYGFEAAQIVKKKKLYPFTNKEEFKFVRLVFKNMVAHKKTRYMFINGLKVSPELSTIGESNLYESNIDPINRFCHLNDLETTGFIIIKKDKYLLETYEDFIDEFDNYSPELHSRSQLVVVAESKDVRAPKFYSDMDFSFLENSIVPIKIFSWDIECQSGNGEDFPDFKNQSDYIGQIGITLWTYGPNTKTKIIITNKPCDPIENIIVLDGRENEKEKENENEKEKEKSDNENEKELLKTFCTLMELLDPDILTGYNTWDFDDKYLNARLDRYRLSSYKNKFSRLLTKNGEGIPIETTIKERRLSSGAYGDNIFNVLECHGRETFDLLIAIRREHKLPSYKLDYVGEHFTKQRKDDLPYKQVFRMMAGNDSKEISTVAKYCVQDTNLVVEIISSQSIIQNYMEMAKVSCVPIGWLLFRGQQCKVFSLIAKESRTRGYVVPVKIPQTDRVFKGATVKQPRRGCYHVPIAGLDFSSLYPSIMIAFNLCYSTIVVDEKYMNIPGIEYDHIKWTDDDGSVTKITFVQHKTFEGNVVGEQGILPTILSNLWLGRKDTKKRMKKVDEFSDMYKILNGKQLAQKVTMNSVYGFTGTGEKGMLSCKEIAASVTAKGREMIAQTSNLAEELYPCTAVYGDSIPGNEKIHFGSLEKMEKININEVEKQIGVGNLWTGYRFFKIEDPTRYFKEQIDTRELNFYTMGSNGPTKIKRIIRHKVPDKKMYKVTVKDENGNLRSVIVTEGHSLINSEGIPVKADELKVGEFLFKNN